MLNKIILMGRLTRDPELRHAGNDGVTGRTVKYWMPLPAPPEKEK